MITNRLVDANITIGSNDSFDSSNSNKIEDAIDPDNMFHEHAEGDAGHEHDYNNDDEL